MCRIAFVSLNTHWWVDDYYSADALYHNLGISFLSTFLEANGHTSLVLDADVLELSDNKVLEHLATFSPDIVAFSEMAQNFPRAIELARQLRTFSSKPVVVFGDYAASLAPSLLVEHIPHTIDAIIPGDGEVVIAEICKAVDKGDELLDPLSYATRCAIQQLPITDRYQPIHFSQLPIPRRVNPLSVLHRSTPPVLNMVASRGCWGSCAFCTRGQFASFTGRSWEGRSPAQILAEADYLQTTFGASDFFFFDDNFVGPMTPENIARIRELCSLLNGRGYTFRISCRADAFLDHPELLLTLRASGLYRVFIGVEAGSPSQLERYNKKLTAENIREGVKQYRRANIAVHIGFIMFDADTTSAEVATNIQFLDEIGQGHFFRNYTSCMVVEPGMHQAQRSSIGKCLRPDWLPEDYDKHAGALHAICRPIDQWFEHIEMRIARGTPGLGKPASRYRQLMSRVQPLYHEVFSTLMRAPSVATATFAEPLKELRAIVQRAQQEDPRE